MRLFLSVLLLEAGIAAGVLLWTTIGHSTCTTGPFTSIYCHPVHQTPGWAKAAAVLAATLGAASGIGLASTGRRRQARDTPNSAEGARS